MVAQQRQNAQARLLYSAADTHDHYIKLKTVTYKMDSHSTSQRQVQKEPTTNQVQVKIVDLNPMQPSSNAL